MPRIVTTFRLDPELLDGLRALWQRDGVPPSETVRRAIKAWLDAKGMKLKSGPRGAVTHRRP